MKHLRDYKRMVRSSVASLLVAAAAYGAAATFLRAADKSPVADGASRVKGEVPVTGAVDFDKTIRPIFAASCVECHGAEKQKGGLRLDSKSAAMAGGASGPMLKPGKGADSLLVHRVKGLGDEDKMPLKKPALTDEQIAAITRWIDQGANWPDDTPGQTVAAAKHWSFEKPSRPVVPVVKSATWARNPIDRFILARLDKESIKPSPEAVKETLLRRASLDLIGLPPTPAEIDAFLADDRPDAYDRQVDRLLASPHYGERWGKHWLDAARYADSNGYSIDAPRSIWKYRDWVIDALNRNKPFDQFVIEQLAGDLLPNATQDQKVATGFHRNTQINQEGGIDPEQFRIEAVMDRVATTGAVFLGLTINCAQCHNHKFDPIPQKDYYRLFAFFNNQDEPTLNLTGGGVEDDSQREKLQEKLKEAELALERATTKGANSPEVKKAKAELAAAKKEEKSLGVTTMVLAERPTPRDTTVFIKGDFTRKGEPVTCGTPTVLPPAKFASPSRPTRLDLARWIVSPDNPLTARVAVNRLWMRYFGKGIVETDNDFGSQGTPPSHPDLLDWLATEFIEAGWDLKHMHRLIVTSATYRQSSNVRADLKDIDANNRLLARQSRLRLDAEIVRDVGLTASGLMTGKVGGPSVFPPQPEGVMGLGQVKREWKVSTGPDRYRRGLYTFLWRANPHPLLTGFDAPDPTSACTRRNRSNTPLQALQLLNDGAFMEFSRSMATRVLSEGKDDPIGYAFRLVTARKSSDDERSVITRLLDAQTTKLSAKADEAAQLAGERIPAGVEKNKYAAWVVVCRALLNLDETITRE